MNLMDITAHLMAAIDKAAGPLDRLADAAEDATAHVAHAADFSAAGHTSDDCPGPRSDDLRHLRDRASRTFERADRYEALAAESSSDIRLGGRFVSSGSRQELRCAAGESPTEEIRKYFAEIGGRKSPVKQAVSVGTGAPRASFGTEAAIHALTRLGYRTQEIGD